LIIFIVILWRWAVTPISLDKEITLKEGQSFSTIVDYLSSPEQIRLKMYNKFHKFDFSNIEQGVYTFSWEYLPGQFVAHILRGPERDYISYTILEWWSIYDIDLDLSKKDLIEPGEYLAYVSDAEKIVKFAEKYEFLKKPSTSSTWQSVGLDWQLFMKNLEGYLYPDTYHLDRWQNLLDQLVSLQLTTFSNKIWDIYKDEINWFDKILKNNWFDFNLTQQELLTIVTVVEKEERQKMNKATVAGIFLNRINRWMRLDADITLCYGLEEPYETCTPKVIVKELYDETNPFNTRQVGGIPPQPIANPSAETVEAVLNFKKSNYLYYLHDPQWWIHYGATSGEHGVNKNKYLK